MKDNRTQFGTQLRNAMLVKAAELKMPYNVIYHSFHQKASFAKVGINKLTYETILDSITLDYANEVAKKIGATI